MLRWKNPSGVAAYPNIISLSFCPVLSCTRQQIIQKSVTPCLAFPQPIKRCFFLLGKKRSTRNEALYSECHAVQCAPIRALQFIPSTLHQGQDAHPHFLLFVRSICKCVSGTHVCLKVVKRNSLCNPAQM